MATSVPGAVEVKLRSFTGLNAVKVFLFDAPVSVDSAQVYPEYICVLDQGLTPNFEFEYTALEMTRITLMVYANTLERVDQIVEFIKYNGGTIQDKAGLDFGTLPDLSIKYDQMEVRRTSERRFITEPTGKNSQRIFGCEMLYGVSLYRTS